jgi:hypothetical protein
MNASMGVLINQSVIRLYDGRSDEIAFIKPAAPIAQHPLLTSKFSQVNAPSAGLKDQRLPSSVERSSKQAFSQFPLDGQWQLGGYAAAARFSVDVQGEGLVQLHRNSSARGVEATIFFRLTAQGRDDRASGG